MQCVVIPGMEMTMTIRSYNDLIKFDNFVDRYNYLRLGGRVGSETFGYERYLNQFFYKSPEWKAVRDYVIVRDNACDLGIKGRELESKIYIHHMNPISVKDLEYRTDLLLNPDYLITVSFQTHQAIHYGDENLLMKDPVVRTKYDTCPWRQ